MDAWRIKYFIAKIISLESMSNLMGKVWDETLYDDESLCAFHSLSFH